MKFLGPCVLITRRLQELIPTGFMFIDNDNKCRSLCSFQNMFQKHILYNVYTPFLKNKTMVVKLPLKLTHSFIVTILKAIARPFFQDLWWNAQNLFCTLVHCPL